MWLQLKQEFRLILKIEGTLISRLDNWGMWRARIIRYARVESTNRRRIIELLDQYDTPPSRDAQTEGECIGSGGPAWGCVCMYVYNLDSCVNSDKLDFVFLYVYYNGTQLIIIIVRQLWLLLPWLCIFTATPSPPFTITYNYESLITPKQNCTGNVCLYSIILQVMLE